MKSVRARCIVRNVLSIAVLSWLGSPLVASAAIAFTTPTDLAPNSPYNGSFNLGLDFTVNTAGYVTSIGVYNPGFSGGVPQPLVNSLSVAIYEVSSKGLVTGTLMSFSGSDWTSTSGSYVLKSLQGGSNPPEGVFLTPGVYSIVAGNYGTATDPPTTAYYMTPQGGPVVMGFNDNNGALALGESRFQPGAVSLGFPEANGPADWADPTFAAGTFDFTAVPEPADFLLLAAGSLLVGYVGRAWTLRRRATV